MQFMDLFGIARCRFDSWWNFSPNKNRYHQKRKCSKKPIKRCNNAGNKAIKSVKPTWWDPFRLVIYFYFPFIFRNSSIEKQKWMVFFLVLRLFQNSYYDDLAQTADIDGLKPVITLMHNDSSQRFLDDLVHFRKDIYRIIDDQTFVKIKG